MFFKSFKSTEADLPLKKTSLRNTKTMVTTVGRIP